MIRGSRSIPVGDFSSTQPANSRFPISAFLCLGFRHKKVACVQGEALERVSTITNLRVKYRVTRMRDRTHTRFVRRNFAGNISLYLTYCSTWVRKHSCVKRAECSSSLMINQQIHSGERLYVCRLNPAILAHIQLMKSSV